MKNPLRQFLTPARVALNAAVASYRLARTSPVAAQRSLSRQEFARFCKQHPELQGEVSNRYEAARRWQWGERSWIWSYVTDARFDAGQADLWEMLRKARYFEQNCPLVQKLLDTWVQYTVGPNGIRIIADSEDSDWVAAQKLWYDRWCLAPDLGSNHSMAAVQSLAARLMGVDGECFILLTRTKAPPYLPRVQIIEAHRVSTPGGLTNEEGKSVVNGVRIDPNTGQPLGYYIRDNFSNPDEHAYYPAANVIHVCDPTRAGMVRCPTPFYSVLNTLHDLDDLARLEMSAAKDAASVSKIIKTPSGELPDEDFPDPEKTDTGTAVNPRAPYYEQRFGAETKVLFSGDTYEQFTSNRPSVAQQWYWRYLAEQICTGSLGIPLAMVFPDGLLGGVTARQVYDQAAGHLRGKSHILGAAFRRVRNYAIEFGSRVDVTIADKPSDWMACTTLPPRQANVDVGRNSNAIIAELEAGIRTFKDVHGELQADYREVFDQKAREAAEIQKAAAKWGVDPSKVLSLAINEPPPPPIIQAAPTQETVTT